jgi:hypothetical protein
MHEIIKTLIDMIDMTYMRPRGARNPANEQIRMNLPYPRWRVSSGNKGGGFKTGYPHE